MEWYIVVKTINGKRYRYRQKTWREGKRVRTRSEYLGPDQLIGYHGTFAKFERFEASYLGSNTECDSATEGFFFASNKNVAVSYVSTHTARQRSLQTKIRTLEERIFILTGKRPYAAGQSLEQFGTDKANKAKTFLGMLERARRKFCDHTITKVVQSKRGDVKRCVLDIKRPYIHNMRGRHYDEEEYCEAAWRAKELGCDGLIIKNTYDPYSFVKIEGDDKTDIYVAFSADQIQPFNTTSESDGDSIISETTSPGASGPEA
jgi:hypothetical protein